MQAETGRVLKRSESGEASAGGVGGKADIIMPFPFVLPTTSFVSYPTFLSCPTHPSLPLTATTYRGVLREVLKKHGRLPPPAQSANLLGVLSAVDDYLPYLFALDAGLSSAGQAGDVDGADGADEAVDVLLVREIEVEWRATLTAALPGRGPPRTKLRGLECEIAMILSTVAYTHSLLGRHHIHGLYGRTTSPSVEQRTTAAQTATRHFLVGASIHEYLVDRIGRWEVPPPTLDVSVAAQTALAALSLAEATLLAVFKDDPYAAAVARSRNKNDTEWMIKAPDIPKIRAHLFARLCVAAGEHADKASAMLRAAGKGVDDDLASYSQNLRRCARAKACRFLGIDADLGGEMGKAVAWLRAGKTELGLSGAAAAAAAAAAAEAAGSKAEGSSNSLSAGLERLKISFGERREDRKIEKGFEWGLDAGRFEELRINDTLEAKWEKINDTVTAASGSSCFRIHHPSCRRPASTPKRPALEARTGADDGDDRFTPSRCRGRRVCSPRSRLGVMSTPSPRTGPRSSTRTASSR